MPNKATSKICKRCCRTLPLTEFYKHSNTKDGLRTICKDCKRKENRKWQHDNPSCHRRAYLNSKKKYPELIRKKHLKETYGLTIEEYDQMFEKQNGICAICGKREMTKNQYGVRRLGVDHNHKTGKIRGLLCHKCNTMLGYADENISILLGATIYLERYKNASNL